MRALFVGGGTGGHLAPGVAVAEGLAARGHDVAFAIAGRDVERALLGPRGLEHHALFRGGLGRPAPWRLAVWFAAVRRWRALLAERSPDVVVVLGGWVALPVVIAGTGARPTVLLEQNAHPGRVQRALSGRVDHVCLAYDGDAMPRGRATTTVTGNPLRDLAPLAAADARARLGLDPRRATLLLMGGSQGAADVNRLAGALVAVVAETGAPWQVLHITGAGRHGVEGSSARVDVPVVRVPFVDDMAAAYAAADVAVCRSGAITVAELAATGTPALFVPYPHHADDHQRKNAAPLVQAGGADVVDADDPRGERSAPARLAAMLPRLAAMADAARSLARTDARDLVVDVVERAAGADSRGLRR